MALSIFTRHLLDWFHSENDRDLPWKHEKNPYKIWISEIILQQTRTEQAIPYYHQLLKAYPTLQALAAAKETELFKHWQGLGYYNRCANLHKAAKKICTEHQGIFPNTYDEIIALPGVGPYTAAAIASFAFYLPYAVLDGNVFRVLARYYTEATPIDIPEGKKIFGQKVQALLDKKNPAFFNQAIMDLGASICTPKAPKCELCPLAKHCKAYQNKTQNDFPIKAKKIKIQERFFHYFILKKGDKIYMEQRTGNDIWKNLFQPFLIETNNAKKIQAKALPLVLQNRPFQYLTTIHQKLTHQSIHSFCYEMEWKKEDVGKLGNGKFYKPEALKILAVPKSIFLLMSKKNYFYPEILETKSL